MNDPASPDPSASESRAPQPAHANVPKKHSRGTFLPPAINTVAFYIIALCILASVVVCILAIWDFAQRDTLWRLATSFLVMAAGTGLFAFLNVKFGERKDS